jgi:Uma2 family endonuclease
MAVATAPQTKAKRLWTYDEVLAELPETNQGVELWDGELVMSPSPRPGHQKLVLRIARLLEDFVQARQLGEVFVSPLDVVFSARRAAQPDVIFIAQANRGIIQDRIRGAPNLLVEVISEGTWRRDRIEKKALYEQFRVAEYWIVDPEARTIEVFTLKQGAYQLHARGEGSEAVASKVVPGFKLSFRQLEV